MSIFMALLLLVLLPLVLLFLLALVRVAWRIVRNEPLFTVAWPGKPGGRARTR